jgi:hypothetical protein
VPLLQAFKTPRKLERVERQFRAISIQIILFATGGAVGHLFGAGRANRIMALLQQKQMLAINGNLISKKTFATLLF